jgi:HK97 family phage portal protein
MEKAQKAAPKAQVIFSSAIMKESAQQEELWGDEIPHPWDDTRGDLLKYYTMLTGFNAYHARCLRLKTDCSVGLGLNVVNGNEDASLKRLSVVNDRNQGALEVLCRVALDMETCGNGFLEVVRGAGGKVVELYHCPAELVTLRPRGASTAFYYRNQGAAVPFPAFTPDGTDENSLLYFANYTQDNRHYGLPDWRGCIPDIELDFSAARYNQKFFENSGVPDMAIIVEGGEFSEETSNAVQLFFQAQFKGLNNSHRTLYLPVNDPDVKVRFEKLAMEHQKDGSFDSLRSRCRDNIASAHGVPPRLVGIVTAGQLGGGGEAVGQLKNFQEIVIEPRQKYFEQKLSPVFQSMLGENVEVKFQRMNTGIQEPDSTYYPAMVNGGILDKNEAREDLGYAALKEEPKPEPKPEETQLKLVQGLEQLRKSL